MVKNTPQANRPAGRHRGFDADTLSVVLLATLGASIALLGVLQILPKSTYPVVNTETWTACLPYVETAIEEALNHRSSHSSNLAANGWAQTSAERYLKTNTLAGGGYAVTMSARPAFDILGTGYVRVAGTSKIVQRAVRVSALDVPVFRFALMIRDHPDLDSDSVHIDSFDSRDPINSPSGRYVAVNARNKAKVACLAGAFDIRNVELPDRVLTRSGGPKPAMPEVMPPFSTAMPPRTGIQFDGVTYDRVFDSGNFMTTSLTGKSLVTGFAVVLVAGDINADLITIQTNAFLQLYGGGASTEFSRVDNQSKLASHLIYFGLPSNASLNLSTDWIGVVCAPDCDLSLMDGTDICGSICVRSLAPKGRFKLHYDEALGASTNSIRSIITSWTEL